MRRVSLPPKAAMLIESMRDLGYTLETALADVIDNSISAEASEIDLLADTNPANPRIAILDNGHGMSEAELLDAMRPGNRNPLDDRSSNDLGRFGLGLKTASFSQCRRVTVATRTPNGLVCARWDLDTVAEADDWVVEIYENEPDIPWLDRLGDQGTLVIWEKLDRLAEADGVAASAEHVIRRIDDAANHLELVFHRYLAGERGIKRVKIRLNNRQLEPFDPFNSKHPATITGPEERIRLRNQDITVQAFTLPHHKKASPQDWARFEGRGGYLRNQGFYVYRAKRLIIHGTWFGLARQTELTKLARVRIDMPNQLDSDWKIDVRKASAQPPMRVRERLRTIIETIGATSKRVYTARGRKLVTDDRIPVWRRVQDKNEIRYVLNADHPVMSEFSSKLDTDLRSQFRRVLELSAASLPVDALFADLGGQPEAVSSAKIAEDDLAILVETTFRVIAQAGTAAASIPEMLRLAEPFRSQWERVEPQVTSLVQESATT